MATPERVAKFLETLPDAVRVRVEALRGVQSRCDVVKNAFLKESKELEERYRRQYAPLFKERYDLVVGENVETDTPGCVPGFWLKVLKSVDLVGWSISKRDEPILKYLLDVSHAPLDDDKPGFKLIFQFADNPYFTPSKLEKTYFMGGPDETELERTDGTQINWAADKNPAYKVIQKKPKHGGGPPRTKVVQSRSFFDFFSPPELPDVENAEELSEIENFLVEDDLEVGCCIKEMLIPSAVAWYTGEMGVDSAGDGRPRPETEDDTESDDDIGND